MYKRWNRLINLLMGCLAGGFLGYAGFTYLDYRNHPEIYALQSAPWYTGIFLYGVIAAAVLAVCLVIKIVLRVLGRRKF